MYNKKSVNILIIFSVFTLFIVFQSFNVSRKHAAKKKQIQIIKDQETEFSNMNYYSVVDEKPGLNIEASVLKIINNKDLFFTDPKGFFYNEDGERLDYKAVSGNYTIEKKQLNLEGDVFLDSPQGEHKSQKIFYNGDKRFIEAKGSVNSTMIDPKTKDKIQVNSDYMNSWLKEGRSLFNGNVKGKVKRKRIYEESFDFAAEKVVLNQLKSLVTLSNNVKLDRNKFNLSAGRAEIFLENFNKKLKYYVLYDDIKLVEKLVLGDGTKQTRRAYSEKLEGYMSEGKVVLTGAPRVEQGNDLIKGYQITLRENVELVEVDDSQSSFELKRN